MDLEEFVEGLDRDPQAERRRLAEEKSYAVTDYLEDFEERFEDTVQGDALFGSTAPSIFVGRSNYPQVSTGLLSPVGHDEDPTDFVTDGQWYQRGYGIDDVFQRRTGLLNSRRRSAVDVEDVWDGFVGVQREVAIARDPVDVEIGLSDRPEIDIDPGAGVRTPVGPNARAESVDLTENPSVPKPVKKTLSDDDWQAQGAMTYLYRRGLDVYDINRVLSAGALGRGENRRLVPTRWSITAVDDTVGQYLRGTIRNERTIPHTEVWYNEYLGNRYWVLLAPGDWEFELVEMKAPGSVWNPAPEDYFVSSAHEGYEGRTGYVEETAGAYYAARLGVLEHLRERGRQAKVLVFRDVTDDYWAPVGVWQVRESVRNAFDGAPDTAGERVAGEHGASQTFHEAVASVATHLPVTTNRLRRKSNMVAGVQSRLDAF
jgi:hypothetical protein